MLGVGLMAAKTDSAVQRPKDNYIHLRIPKAECQADMFRPYGFAPPTNPCRTLYSIYDPQNTLVKSFTTLRALVLRLKRRAQNGAEAATCSTESPSPQVHHTRVWEFSLSHCRKSRQTGEFLDLGFSRFRVLVFRVWSFGAHNS